MTMLQATLALYRDAGRDTLKALPRSGVALLFLILAGAMQITLGIAMGGAGTGGGFVLGFVNAFLTGWYLALVHLLIGQGRKLRMDDLREQMGVLFSEAMTVTFVFTIPRLILRLSVPAMVVPFVLGATILFNPAPEVIQHERGDAMGAIGKSLSFMRDNWPEWLAAHVVGFGVMGLVLQLVLPDGWVLVAMLAGLYGPFMDFVSLGTLGYALVGLGPLGTVGAGVLLVCGHAVMLFRAALYKRLAKSSRRSRAWQARIS